MYKLTIDGIEIEAPKGTTVYQAAKNAGIDIPIFCYHDRMPPFGACRVCLVEVEKMNKLQASCTLEVQEGMRVTTQSKMALDGRKEILELLLINHPLDCPICDRGGECPLQDNALKHGPGLSRFFEDKRRFKKPIPLGPVLMLDRERCIVCARCIRFGDMIAKDHALQFIERGYRTEVGTKDGGTAQSKFIGNTIMICPVGALTSQVYRFRARPWDNETAPSTCTLCPVGCSLKLDSRDGELMRTRSLENRAVNDLWLCDKGWFGYEFGSHPKRLIEPLIRKNGILSPSTWEEALSLIAAKMTEFKSGKKLAALGGNPLTTEENYLFQQLFRKNLEVNHVDHRVGMPLIKEGIAPGMQISINELEKAPLIYLLGLDITEEFPVIWLTISQAINRGAKVIFIGHYAPEIASSLSQVFLHPPGEELNHLPKESGVFLLGRQYLASPNRLAVLALLQKIPNSSLNLMEGRGNSQGARFAGMHDSEWNSWTLVNQTHWDFLYVAGSNPALKFPKKIWDAFRSQLKFLVVQDLFLTETAEGANVVLPTLAYTEKKGTFINIEGRPQQMQRGKEPPENVFSDGEIFLRIAQKLKSPLIFEKEFTESLKQEKIALNSSNDFSQEEIPQAKGLRATFSPVLFDEGVRMQHNEHLSKLTPTPLVRIHPSVGIEDGKEVIIKAEENSLKAKVKWDTGVAPDTIVIPMGYKSLPVHELSPQLINGIEVGIE